MLGADGPEQRAAVDWSKDGWDNKQTVNLISQFLFHSVLTLFSLLIL